MNITFVHHEFHEVSKSSMFMVEVLLDLGHKVEVKRRTDSEELLREGSPDLFILWQSERLLDSVVKIGRPIICIPMLDDALGLNVESISKYRKVKFLSFSKNLHRFLSFSGLDSSYIQYWPKPPEVYSPSKEPRIFFWERNPTTFNIDDVLRITEVSKLPIMFRRLADPHDVSLVSNSVQNGRIIFMSNDWLTKENYYQIIRSNQVFISPRAWEGIGLSFLEAMSNGCCVVAINNPTMNEYIVNGVNGLLINNRNSQVDLTKMNEIGENARRSAFEGFRAFDAQFRNIVESAITDLLVWGGSQRRRILPKRLTLRGFIFLQTFRRWH